MENKFIVLYWDNFNGFKRRVVRSTGSWGDIVAKATSQLCIMDNQIISISLDTNVPIEE